MEHHNAYLQDLQRSYTNTRLNFQMLEKELNSLRLAVQQMDDDYAELFADKNKVFADNDKRYSAVIARLTKRVGDVEEQLEELREERDKVVMALGGIR
jgi:chromosome segregation ATPase